MSDTLRVGVIGAGAISVFHMAGWAAQEGVEVVALCDTDAALAERRAAEAGVARVYTDAAAMLATERLDAIDIITPVRTHAELVRMAADRGVHVMCQKPMTPTLAEGRELVADVGDRVRFMVHENYRWRPHYMRVGALLADGRIGTPKQARMRVRSASMVAPDGGTPPLLARQPYLKDFRRLLIFEVLIHHMDALRALFGEMEVIHAETARINPNLAGEDAALISMTGEGGLSVAIDANISAPGYWPLPGDQLEIVGTRDTLILDRDRIYLASDPEAAEVQDMAANYQACFTGAITDFVAGLRTGAAFATDRHDNVKTLALMESAYRAAGIPVSR